MGGESSRSASARPATTILSGAGASTQRNSPAARQRLARRLRVLRRLCYLRSAMSRGVPANLQEIQAEALMAVGKQTGLRKRSVAPQDFGGAEAYRT